MEFLKRFKIQRFDLPLSIFDALVRQQWCDGKNDTASALQRPDGLRGVLARF
jgi:hypothetical protein